MADQGQSEGTETPAPTVNTSTHPLVSAILGDNDPPPGVVALVGYFGPSKRADHVRLYLTLDFTSYLELPTTDNLIVSTEPVNADDANSPTRVIVKSEMKLEVVRIESTEASYLQGAIAGSFLSKAAGGARATSWAEFPGAIYLGSSRLSIRPCVCNVCF